MPYIYIYKENDKDCNNYRYIGVTNSVGRVLSRVIKKNEV